MTKSLPIPVLTEIPNSSLDLPVIRFPKKDQTCNYRKFLRRHFGKYTATPR
jgi:hypothetical protein